MNNRQFGVQLPICLCLTPDEATIGPVIQNEKDILLPLGQLLTNFTLEVGLFFDQDCECFVSLIPPVLPLLPTRLPAKPGESSSLHCQVLNRFCCSLDPNRQGEAARRSEGRDDRRCGRQMEGMRHRVPNSGEVLRERFVLLSSATLHCPSFSLLPCLLLSLVSPSFSLCLTSLAGL